MESNEEEEDDYHHPELVHSKFLQAIQMGLSNSRNFPLRSFRNDVRVSDETLIDSMSEAAYLEGDNKAEKGREVCM